VLLFKFGDRDYTHFHGIMTTKCMLNNREGERKGEEEASKDSY